jgi:hypothetical protein
MNVIHFFFVNKRKPVVWDTIGVASSLNLNISYRPIDGTKSIKWNFTPSICSATIDFEGIPIDDLTLESFEKGNAQSRFADPLTSSMSKLCVPASLGATDDGTDGVAGKSQRHWHLQ